MLCSDVNNEHVSFVLTLDLFTVLLVLFHSSVVFYRKSALYKPAYDQKDNGRK